MQTEDINYTLIKASGKGCIEKVTVLLDLGVDVNYKGEVKYQNLNSTCALLAGVIHTYTTVWPISSLACKHCW